MLDKEWTLQGRQGLLGVALDLKVVCNIKLKVNVSYLTWVVNQVRKLIYSRAHDRFFYLPSLG